MSKNRNISFNKGTKDDFALEKKIDQSIRYFSVPARMSKVDVFDNLLSKIDQQEVRPVSNIRRLYAGVISVAASVAILFALYFTLGVQRYEANQEASVYFLPDDSRVVLAEESSLSYSKLWFNRSVNLKGEAYFEVKKGEGFYVGTPEGGVLVIGTRFNVNAYNNQLLVNCYQGTVGIDFEKQKIRLNEGFKFAGENKAFEINNVQNFGYPEYSHFNYECKDKEIGQVFPDIEKYFGVNIECHAELSKSFSGTINTADIEEVLDIICTSMDLESEKQGNNFVINSNQ